MRVLVHICCGPCAITVLQWLADAGHELTGFFFNPNIQPLAEYLRRREGAIQVAQRLGVPLILADAESKAATGLCPVRPEGVAGGGSLPVDSEIPWYSPEQLREAGIACRESAALPEAAEPTPWLSLPEAVDPAPWLRLMAGREGNRCETCWRIRLWRTARQAAQGGYDAFTTSLLYSRYQNHDLIAALGRQAAAARGIGFVYEDFRASWQQGITLSREWGIYRQPYCGCLYSEYERYAKKLRAGGM